LASTTPFCYLDTADVLTDNPRHYFDYHLDLAVRTTTQCLQTSARKHSFAAARRCNESEKMGRR